MIDIDSPILVQPKNTMPQIDAIWAFVSVDPHDGNEGVLGAPLMGPGSLVPLIAADEARLRDLEPWAQAMAKAGGIKVRLVRFHQREVVREIGP